VSWASKVRRRQPATVRAVEDRSHAWRLRITSPNGQIIATSNESFDSRSNAERAVDMLLDVRLVRGKALPHFDANKLTDWRSA
jgi:uncharacterized protein YegP (UPF0339 family)